MQPQTEAVNQGSAGSSGADSAPLDPSRAAEQLADAALIEQRYNEWCAFVGLPVESSSDTRAKR